LSSLRRPELIIGPDGSFIGADVSPPPPPAYRPKWWLHALLLFLTLVTTTFFGALFAGWLPEDLVEQGLKAVLTDPRFYLEGLKFSLPLLTILLAHEMGHYLTARRHGLAATPPFFIPVPFGIGTLGAVIRIKEPIRTKNQLLDIGAAGPLAGFVATLPFLVYGVAASRVAEIPLQKGVIVFGEPLLFRAVEWLFFPALAAGQDLYLHPVGFAAWFGLLITALNMLPFAQLDGGHVAYAMFGRRHRRAVWPLWILLFLMGFKWTGWWIWAVIALVMGVVHPPIWDEHSVLDRRRRIIGWIALVVFVLSFMPEPVRIVAAVLP
jgi:membrane-associated protease RseP (regulator of RpoE activity)